MHFLDLYWLRDARPASRRRASGLVDVAAFCAVGGVFLAAFGWAVEPARTGAARRSAPPESLSFENV